MKASLVGSSRHKVKENCYRMISYGMEKERFLPKDWTLDRKISEKMLEYENLTNKLLKNSTISPEDMSQGMRQLEEMMDRIYSLQDQIQE